MFGCKYENLSVYSKITKKEQTMMKYKKNIQNSILITRANSHFACALSYIQNTQCAGDHKIAQRSTIHNTLARTLPYGWLRWTYYKKNTLTTFDWLTSVRYDAMSVLKNACKLAKKENPEWIKNSIILIYVFFHYHLFFFA